MRKISQAASKVFTKLFALADDNGGHIKVDNSETFMAVSVERLYGDFFSVAHYYEQNGDLVCDPDVVFWVTPAGVFPVSFEQGGFLHQKLVSFEDGKPVSYMRRAQKDCAVFCTTWAKNLKYQQEL